MKCEQSHKQEEKILSAFSAPCYWRARVAAKSTPSTSTLAGASEWNGAFCDVAAPAEEMGGLMVEQPNGDFAFTILRQFFFAAFMHPFWKAMTESTDVRLAAHAEKAEKELAYHVRHTGEWVIRLGDGTDESARRMNDALEALSPFVGEMFEQDSLTRALADAGILPDMDRIESRFDHVVADTLRIATLPAFTPEFAHTGGREGRHTEYLGHLLAELQFMQRAYPGQRW